KCRSSRAMIAVARIPSLKRSMPSSGPPRPPLTDSPWFWVYLFATFALLTLFVMRPRVLERQAQIERKEQGRKRAIEQISGQTPQTPLSTPENTQITLAPLFLIMGLVWLVAAFMVWRRLRRP